jgi:hypothetical protein
MWKISVSDRHRANMGCYTLDYIKKLQNQGNKLCDADDVILTSMQPYIQYMGSRCSRQSPT